MLELLASIDMVRQGAQMKALSQKNEARSQLMWRAKWLLNRVLRMRGPTARVLICWLIGCLVLSTDEVNTYDTRMQARGEQTTSSEIVIINLKADDSTRLIKNKRPLSEMELSESLMWNESLWQKLFENLLKQNPKFIGVTLHFPEGSARRSNNEYSNSVFSNSKIFWAYPVAGQEHPALPIFANSQASNIGTSDLIKDEDGVIRRFHFSENEPTHLTEKIVEKSIEQKNQTEPSTRIINYRGGARAFSQFLASDVISGRVSAETFKNKIIFIGVEGLASHQYQTPLGLQSRALIMAQIADNILQNRWVHRAPYLAYALLLLVYLLLALFIIHKYPQSIAVTLLLWVILLTSALSLWVFDSWYLWLPLESPIVMIVVTWIIFIGHQASVLERQSWQLRQERLYLDELEQLKNNFVSLISHDLKTPIAKIQSIVDRLALQNQNTEIDQDLRSLRQSSDELHRYIQSILKVLKVESRDFRIHREICDINQLVDEAVASLNSLANEKNLVLIVETVPIFSIEADTTLIREVLINLIENAIKYSHRNGKIWVRTHEYDDRVDVEIQDTGEGISPDEIATIWQKFVRGKEQDLKSKGTGLGLYLVKYFIELHGGSVHLESQLHHGTRIGFSLPLESEPNI